MTRNFWIAADIDGITTPIGTGPRRHDGGFDLTISIRDHGASAPAVSIIGRAYSDGTLELTVRPLHERMIDAGCDHTVRLITHR
jgi:hypothetical protein